MTCVLLIITNTFQGQIIICNQYNYLRKKLFLHFKFHQF
jgi:hypothetical protein